jgi:hypothetical protein
VKWPSLPESLTRWEDCEALHQHFPRAPAWGQAGFSRGGNVMNEDAELTGSVETSELADRRHSQRVRRPITRVSDPEWTARLNQTCMRRGIYKLRPVSIFVIEI